MMVLQEKNGTDIKYDEAAMKRVVRIRWIELGVYNKNLEPRLDSNTKLLTNKTRLWFYWINPTRNSLKFKQWH